MEEQQVTQLLEHEETQAEKSKSCELEIQREHDCCRKLRQAEMARRVAHEQDTQNLEGLLQHFEDEGARYESAAEMRQAVPAPRESAESQTVIASSPAVSASWGAMGSQTV